MWITARYCVLTTQKVNLMRRLAAVKLVLYTLRHYSALRMRFLGPKFDDDDG